MLFDHDMSSTSRICLPDGASSHTNQWTLHCRFLIDSPSQNSITTSASLGCIYVTCLMSYQISWRQPLHIGIWFADMAILCENHPVERVETFPAGFAKQLPGTLPPSSSIWIRPLKLGIHFRQSGNDPENTHPNHRDSSGTSRAVIPGFVYFPWRGNHGRSVLDMPDLTVVCFVSYIPYKVLIAWLSCPLPRFLVPKKITIIGIFRSLSLVRSYLICLCSICPAEASSFYRPWIFLATRLSFD